MTFGIDIDIVTAVRSPCQHICEMDAATGFCKGCYRTIDEIMDWAYLNEAARRAVIAELPARRAGAAKGSGRSL